MLNTAGLQQYTYFRRTMKSNEKKDSIALHRAKLSRAIKTEKKKHQSVIH